MAMFKAAQFIDSDLVVSLPTEAPKDEVILYDEKPSEEEVLDLHSPKQEIEISFKLPLLPGAPDAVVELGSDDELEVDKDEDKKDKAEAKDKDEDAKDPLKMPKKEFLAWFRTYLDKIPKHKGETIALERAAAYLKRALDMLSKCVQQDFDGEIDIAKAEDARYEIENGIERLYKELDHRKKKAVSENGLIKEAFKSASVGGIIITVPIFISRIARVCINGSVSNGKDIKDIFKRQAERWKLTDREQAEVAQLIIDMGYPPVLNDRGFGIDDKEPYKYNSENNFELAPNYSS